MEQYLDRISYLVVEELYLERNQEKMQEENERHRHNSIQVALWQQDQEELSDYF
jgi:hypothetical protein